MTVRDWLQLLIVPFALVVIGFLFEMQQAERENQRDEAARQLADQRAQDEALQAYLDQMSQLMLDRKLLEAEQGTPLYTLAQARTSTLILRLDAKHNESVTRFLINSGLAVSGEASARLLRGITLSHATLSDAYLRKADLSDAYLRKADLSNADLSYADLSNANLGSANLSGADLSYAFSLSGERCHAYLRCTYLGGANLSNADLNHAVLNNVVLSNADLSDANLHNTGLRGAYLSGAILVRAIGITNEELEHQAKSLEGATMPNGQKYEDWIKSKGRGEDGENSGP